MSLIRSTGNQLTYNAATTKWSSTGFADLEFSFSLAEIRVFAGGVLLTTWPIPGIAELSNLFEWWRLDYVEMQIFPPFNVADTEGTSFSGLPVFNVVFDGNDTNLITLSDALQYESLKTYQLANIRSSNGLLLKLRPTTLMAAASPSGTFSSIRPEKTKTNPWVSTLNSTIPHYGMKIFVDDLGYAQNFGQSYGFYVRTHFSVQETK
jgi:hypothetical protein